jgi:hypothetical protein
MKANADEGLIDGGRPADFDETVVVAAQAVARQRRSMGHRATRTRRQHRGKEPLLVADRECNMAEDLGVYRYPGARRQTSSNRAVSQVLARLLARNQAALTSDDFVDSLLHVQRVHMEQQRRKR